MASAHSAKLDHRELVMQKNQKRGKKGPGRPLRIVRGDLRKPPKKTLSKSEERFQLIARATNDAVWDWNLVTDEVWWNEGLTTLFGYSMDEVEPDSAWWSEHIHPEDKERVLSGLDSVVHSGGQLWSGEYRYARRDGTYADVFDRGYVMHDRKGKPVRMIGAMVNITERKRSEEALRESQQRLQAILDYSPSVIFLKDTSGRYMHCNPPIERLCGRSRDQIVGKSDWELFSPEEAGRFTSNDRKVLEAGHPIEFEETALHPDGPHTSIVSKFPLRDAQGEIYAIGGVVTDITGRKHVEQALLVRNQQLQTLHEIAQTILDTSDFKLALDRILEKTLQVASFDIGTIRLFDPHTEILEPLAFSGFRDLNNVRPKSARSDASESGPVLLEVLRSKGAFVAEDLPEMGGLRGFQREGVQSAVVVPVRSGQQMLGTIQLGSRTARKFNPGEIRLLEIFGHQLGVAVQKFRFYEEIQNNSERIRALHEIDRAITSTLDLHTILDVLLEKASLLFPVPSATTVRLLNQTGKLEATACRNLDREEWQADLLQTPGVLSELVLASKAPVIISNLWIDPRTRHLQVFRKHHLLSYLGIPLIVKEKVLGRLGFYTKHEHEFTADEVEFLTTIAAQGAIVIHNAQMYQEMVKANKVRQEFLSVISHELRTPLNLIMGYAAMVEQRTLGEINAQQENALGKVIAQSQHLADMINNILAASALDTGSSKLESGEVHLEDLLAELKADFRASSPKEINLVWEFSHDLPILNTDGVKLKQILHGLITNAMKFTEQGTVMISTRYSRESRTVEFQVADTGSGIPKEMLPLIFEKFRQVDSSEARLHEGVGIGLYIVKGYTELLGGTIDVKSDLGKGSCFTVKIPVESSLRTIS